MANPYVAGSYAQGANVGSAVNLDEFYGYGELFMNPDQFEIELKERIHLFGADASPFFSWSSMVRKNPTGQTSFKWIEDELFIQRDIKAKMRRHLVGTRWVYTIQIMQGQDWQAFEAPPLADAIACSGQATGWVGASLQHQPLNATIKNAAGTASVTFFPTQEGLNNSRGSYTYATKLSNSLNLYNEFIINDSSDGTAVDKIGGWFGSDTAYNKKHAFETTSTKTMTAAVLNGAAWFNNNTNVSVDPIDVTIHVATPNETLMGFAQGSGLPGESRKRTRTFENFTQIFKTPYSISNTLKAVKTYGGPELARLRVRKAIQHKIDIERAILFQGGGIPGAGGYGYIGGDTENPVTRFKGLGIGSTGITNAGWIISKNGGWNTDFQVSSTATFSEWTALTEKLFEDMVDSPSSSKMVYAGKKWFGALANMAYALNGSTSAYQFGQINQKDGRLGTKIRTIETPHGDLNFVHMPHFRGQYEDYALVVDMNNIEIRPLRGRDTTLVANAGDKTVDGQIDFYITEVGFECRHEYSHAILKLV